MPLANCSSPSLAVQEDAFRSTFQTVQPTASLTSGSDKIIHFTVKYRVNHLAPRQWAQIQQGSPPGQIVFQSSGLSSEIGVSNFLDLGPGWMEKKSCGHPNVYELRSQIFIPKSDTGQNEEELSTQVLGRVPDHLRYLALVRIEPYWLGPRQGGDFFHLDEDAILCAFMTRTGHGVTLLTMAEVAQTYSIIRSNEWGEIVITARCDSNEDNHFYCVVSNADTFEESCSAAMRFVSCKANTGLVGVKDRFLPHRSDRSDAIFDTWVDGLSFCTWNALGQDLSEEKILRALPSLADSNISISTLLIDDNWQQLGPIPGHDFSDSHFRGMTNLICNSSVAPDGLAALVNMIKKAHPRITDIGVWHALIGYWGGISPCGQIAKDYDTVQVPTYLMDNVPATITSLGPSSISQFYDDFYSYFSNSGITFVKTDVQHMLSTFRTRAARRDLTDEYQTSWTRAHNKYFQSKAIACMAQIPQALYSSHMQTVTPRIVLRNSDDFYPEVQASQPWHIWKNAHNSLFTRHLNVLPDWDMFQTSHMYSSYHAVARCISSGSLLITDVPGKHDVELIRQMTALDKEGRSIALRPGIARATRVFDMYTDGNILRVGSVTNERSASRSDNSRWRASLLGLWIIAERGESTMIAVQEFVDIESIGKEIVVGSFRYQQIFGPFGTTGEGPVDVNSLIYVTTLVRGWEILTAYPVFRPLGDDVDVAIAVVGLRDKISGAAGVLDVQTVNNNERVFTITIHLKALGKLGLWISGLPDGILSYSTLAMQGGVLIPVMWK